jgi:hypothetical protein
MSIWKRKRKFRAAELYCRAALAREDDGLCWACRSYIIISTSFDWGFVVVPPVAFLHDPGRLCRCKSVVHRSLSKKQKILVFSSSNRWRKREKGNRCSVGTKQSTLCIKEGELLARGTETVVPQINHPSLHSVFSSSESPNRYLD